MLSFHCRPWFLFAAKEFVTLRKEFYSIFPLFLFSTPSLLIPFPPPPFQKKMTLQFNGGGHSWSSGRDRKNFRIGQNSKLGCPGLWYHQPPLPSQKFLSFSYSCVSQDLQPQGSWNIMHKRFIRVFAQMKICTHGCWVPGPLTVFRIFKLDMYFLQKIMQKLNLIYYLASKFPSHYHMRLTGWLKSLLNT